MKHVLCILLLSGCATFRPMIAANADADDYRAYRLQSTWGARLAAAQRYLERHPDGVFAAEVKTAFDEEEPRYFARAQESREGIRDYLSYLPHGPHAAQALALLVNFDTKVEDLAMAKLLKAARSTELRLAEAADQRRRADEWLSFSIAALVSDAPWGRAIDDSPELVSQLKGEHPSTWGGTPTRTERRFSVEIPSPDGLVERLVVATLELDVQGGLLRAASLEGPDLFVRWAELDALRPLDPALSGDRAFAAGRIRDRLVGMLERRFPEGRCAGGGDEADLLARQCDGRRVRVTMGGRAGDIDRLDFAPVK
jgi:hypothetical protein